MIEHCACNNRFGDSHAARSNAQKPDNETIMKIFRNRWQAIPVLMLLFLAATAGTASAADYRPLVGRWQRTDGGYVIDIRRVGPDGSMQAGYFNPRPINVSRAQASLVKDYLKVEVELRDTGYPGSSYTLLYDPNKDALLGFYYQAIQRQQFDVVFVRMNQQ